MADDGLPDIPQDQLNALITQYLKYGSTQAQQMTHQPVQPDPAQPYLDATKRGMGIASEFLPGYGGGLQGVANRIGVETPDWSKRLGETLHNEAADTAIGMATPLKGVGAPHPAWISTRFPTGMRASENPISQRLVINSDAMRDDPKQWKANADLVKAYPNRPKPKKKGGTEKVPD